MPISAREHYGEISKSALDVLRAVHNIGEMSRADLCSAASMSTTSIHRAVIELTAKGLVAEEREALGRQGRPGTVISLVPGALVAVGVDVGSYNTRVGVVDWTGRVLHEERRPTGDTPPDALLEMVGTALDECGGTPLAGVGLGISGLVDHKAGRTVFCPNIPQWNDYNAVEAVRGITGFDAWVDTSARCMAMAESVYGCGKGYGDLIFVSVGQSVSAGIMINGTIFRGSNSFSGEVGHVTAVTGGYPCTCGNDGCLENYVTESQVYLMLDAKLRDTKAHSILRTMAGPKGRVTAETFRIALRQGDRLAHEHLMETGAILGTTLANLVNVMDPRLLVLGGGVMELYPEMVEEVRRSIKVKALNPIQNKLQVVASGLGWNGAVAGAALMTFLPFLGSEA